MLNREDVKPGIFLDIVGRKVQILLVGDKSVFYRAGEGEYAVSINFVMQNWSKPKKILKATKWVAFYKDGTSHTFSDEGLISESWEDDPIAVKKIEIECEEGEGL